MCSWLLHRTGHEWDVSLQEVLLHGAARSLGYVKGRVSLLLSPQSGGEKAVESSPEDGRLVVQAGGGILAGGPSRGGWEDPRRGGRLHPRRAGHAWAGGWPGPVDLWEERGESTRLQILSLEHERILSSLKWDVKLPGGSLGGG